MSETSYDKAKTQMLGYMQGTCAVVASQLDYIIAKLDDQGWTRDEVMNEALALSRYVQESNAHVEKKLKESYEETMNTLKL